MIGLLFLSVAVSTTNLQFSRMQTRDRYSLASDLPQLHIAKYGWVFLLAASSQKEAFGLLMRLNDDLHLMNCGRCGQRGTIFCLS